MNRIKKTRGIRLRFVIMGLLVSSFILAQGYDHNNHNGRNHYEDWPDSLKVINVNGTVSVDDSMMMPMYYLETDGNDSLDYILGFGPWWFEPVSGAVRPSEGDVVAITGGLYDAMTPAMLVVFEINGLAWRDSTDAPPWSGGWVHSNASDTTWVFCPTDSLDHIRFPPQGINGMMGNMGMNWPDSIYCQFEEMNVDSLPGLTDVNMFEGYVCNFNNDVGEHMMMGQGNGQGMMGFNRSVNFQFHYDENNLNTLELDEGSIQLFYLDEQGIWQEETNADLDITTNTINLENSAVAEYYALKANANKVVIEDEDQTAVPQMINIESVYPNPFNPQVTIQYVSSEFGKVQIQVYDLQGRLVKNLFNGLQEKGTHSVIWDASSDMGNAVTSGTYLLKITAGSSIAFRQLTLLR